MGIELTQVEVAGPLHESFGLERAWYLFGMFGEAGICRMILVEADNPSAIHMIESIVQKDGAVSNTCGLLSVSPQEPQIRSSVVEQETFVNFILDIVSPDRWLDSPFLVGMFNRSLSEVDRISAGMKIDRILREAEFDSQSKEDAQDTEVDEEKIHMLVCGLTGLGFDKRQVQRFAESVSCSDKPLQDLIVDGISALSGGSR